MENKIWSTEMELSYLFQLIQLHTLRGEDSYSGLCASHVQNSLFLIPARPSGTIWPNSTTAPAMLGATRHTKGERCMALP